MTRRNALLTAFVLLFAASSATADTIVLKNGRKIYAEHPHEVNGNVEYDVGENTFAIPKSSVDHIEGGGVAPVSSSSAALPELPPQVTANATIKGAESMLAKIVKDGHVDIDELNAIEQQGNPELSAAALFTAGKFEDMHGNPDKARVYLQRAMSLMPDNHVIVEQFAAVLIEMHRFSDAVPYAQQATRLSPGSAEAHALLGYALFNSEKTKEAIAELKKSVELHPDATIQAILDKAQRESEAEAGFGEQASGHFTMRYEGRQAPAELRRQIMDTLERHYDDLVREFGITPKQNIIVSLYTEQGFFDVTHAAGWSAAQNDGKLRIPISGLDSVNSEMSRILKHELAHSFIAQITRNRCPTWLNEGIAQAVEPQTAQPYGAALARMFAAGHEVPLNQLEGSFGSFDDRMAAIAYGESLAAVEYINQTYGMSDAVRILQRIGEGASTEAALRAVVHSGYESFEQDVGTYLKRTYGN